MYFKDKEDTNIDDETAEDCAYARIFDFMIWELLIMDQIGSDRQGLIYEIQDIFREKEFIRLWSIW